MTYTPTVFVNCYVSIAGNVISDHCTKVEIPFKVDEKETTAFGSSWKTRVGGLKDSGVKLTFNNDYSASNLNSIMFALLGNVVTFEVRPDAGTVTTANPKYTGSILINGWTPLSGGIGDLATVDVDYPTSGPVAQGTS